MITLEISYGL